MGDLEHIVVRVLYTAVYISTVAVLRYFFLISLRIFGGETILHHMMNAVN